MTFWEWVFLIAMGVVVVLCAVGAIYELFFYEDDDDDYHFNAY